ncbi:MAG: ABC transporter substrate-binding protein [Thermoanaerobacteraceae bacterium]|nr:ABC transporter substrate-binding protein [Thermoanaerobacteraceae bacterium]
MKRFLSIILISLLVLVLLTGCSSNNIQQPQADQGQNKSNFPVTITDFMGRQITIEKEPQRIVTLAPSNTEILYELGLDDKIVGVSEYDDFPPQVNEKPKLGGFSTPNIEAVIDVEPDIVIVGSSFGEENAKKLEEAGIPVIVTAPESFEDIYTSYEMIGRITGAGEKANEIVQNIKDGVSEVQKKIEGKEKPKVYFVVSMGQSNYTAGKGTFIDAVINIAGGENVASDVEGWKDYSLEKLVEHDPDIIVASKHAGEVDKLADSPGYKETKAAKNGKIFIIDDNIIVRPTSRILEGINEMAKIIHPEIFK